MLFLINIIKKGITKWIQYYNHEDLNGSES